MRPFSIIANAKIWLGSGAILLIASIYMFFAYVRLSIQFTGGMEFKITDLQNIGSLQATVEQVLSNNGIEKPEITTSQSTISNNGATIPITTLLISTPNNSEAAFSGLTYQVEQSLIGGKHIASSASIIETSIIGPSIGAYMRTNALRAVVIGILLMAGYMMLSFAAMRHSISPGILAVITVVTMLFDIGIPSGAYGIWMSINQTVQIDTIYIIALLTIMGYSINDTIIIFDRIRENIIKAGNQSGKKQLNYAMIFEDSLRQTMRRSIGTSLSTFLVIVAMYVFGTGVIQSFALVMGIGILAGSFSSIFLAAPLAYYMIIRNQSKKK